MKNAVRGLEIWFATGSQHLYGEETLKQVAKHSVIIVKSLNDAESIPVKVAFKPVLKSTEEIYNLCQEADRKSTRLNSSHTMTSRMPSSA